MTTKKRRAKGDGSIYLQGRIYWIAYRGPDGQRKQESSGSERRGDAERMLRRRVGAREHGLPVIKNAEKLTFEEAAKAVIDDYLNKGKKSIKSAQRRIRLHLQPHFAGRRLIGITPEDIRKFVTKRKADTIITRKARTVTLEDGTERVIPEQRKPVSPQEINHELTMLKRIFNLAVSDGKLAMPPKIEMLEVDNVRSGFLDGDQVRAVLPHLTKEIQAVIAFAYITGWRIKAEVLPLEWRRVDFKAGEVRLDAGKTKNKKPRVFPMTADLRALLKAQHVEHVRLEKAGHIVPYVFFREVAQGRGGEKKPKPIISFNKAWKAACKAAGYPGRNPHDLRRSAVRNFVRAGLSEHVAMKLSGHKTPSVFRRYDIVTDGDLHNAAKRLDAATSSRVSAAR